MTRQGAGDFALLLADLDAEAVAEGPTAMEDLRALQVKYRLIACSSGGVMRCIGRRSSRLSTPGSGRQR